MRKTILKTKRLKLTIAQESDIEPLYRGCFSDWKVMKFLLGKTFTFEETRTFIKKHFSKGQFLKFTVILNRENGEVLGYGGMFSFPYNDQENEYEFGYILKQEAWGKGYATELSLGQIEKLQESFEGASIVASAHPLNLASKQVLEKVGMELVESSVELPNRGLRDVYRLKQEKKCKI